MAKDDWPESTEAGALIDEAYRKGWLPRDAVSKEGPTCRFCGGEGERPKLQDCVPAALPPEIEMETCPECAGTGRPQTS